MHTSKGRSRPKLLWALIGTLLTLFIAVPAVLLSHARQIARQASCANDLRSLALRLEEYAENHHGLFPPIHPTRGNIMMDPTGFYPEILNSSAWVQCEYSDARRHPNQPDENDLGLEGFNDGTFFYLPWAIQNEEEGIAFIEAYQHLDLNHREADLPITTRDGHTRTLPRTRYHDPNNTNGGNSRPAPVPLLVEWPHTRHARLCVLYSDGSVWALELGEGFPASNAFMAGMRKIAGEHE